MKIAEGLLVTGCAGINGDGDRGLGRATAVVPFLNYGVISSRPKIEIGVQAGAVDNVSQDAGRSVDAHAGYSFGAARAGGRDKIYGRANGTVRGRSGYVDTGGWRSTHLDLDGRSGRAATIVPRLDDGVVGARIESQ